MAGSRQIEINLDEVARLAGLGLSIPEICASLGVSQATLYRRKAESEEFERALKAGRAKVAQDISNALVGKALSGDVTAMIWYEKTRRGMSDRMSINLDMTKLSDDELQRIIES